MRKLLAIGLLFAASAFAVPTIRGTGFGTGTTVPLPSGTAVGDFVLIWLSDGNSPSLPTGWTLVDFANGAGIAGIIMKKTMTSGDISAGSVVVPFSGGAAIGPSYGIASVVGATTSGVREHPFAIDFTGAHTHTLSTSGAVLASDLGFFFGAVRCHFSSISISIGTLIGDANNDTSGGFYSDASLAGGVNTAIFNYGTCGGATTSSMVILIDATPPPSTATFVILY